MQKNKYTVHNEITQLPMIPSKLHFVIFDKMLITRIRSWEAFFSACFIKIKYEQVQDISLHIILVGYRL